MRPRHKAAEYKRIQAATDLELASFNEAAA